MVGSTQLHKGDRANEIANSTEVSSPALPIAVAVAIEALILTL